MGSVSKRGREGAGLGGRGGVAKENIDQVAEAAATITLDCVGDGFCFKKGEGAGLGGRGGVAKENIDQVEKQLQQQPCSSINNNPSRSSRSNNPFLEQPIGTT